MTHSATRTALTAALVLLTSQTHAALEGTPHAPLATAAVSGTTEEAGFCPVAGPARATARPGVRGLGRLPLHFARHDDPSGDRYVSRGPGYTVHLRAAETTLALRAARGACPAGRPCPEADGTAAVLHMELVGADPRAPLAGSDELPGRAHYFVGTDPRRWRTDVPLYATVRARNAYPGIDVVHYGNGEQLEHDFVVAPGADPRRIRVAYHGQSGRLRIDGAGDLVVPVPGGEVVQRAPVTYQEGAGGREPVAARYVLHEVGDGRGRRQEVGFAVAAYDATRPLVIDPILAYATYLGGTGSDGAGAVALAVDAAGSAYVAGLTGSTDFPTAAPLQGPAGGNDAFVTKLTPDGSGLVWSTYLGGALADFAFAVAVDAAGSAYVAGLTQSSDFPTQSAFQAAFAGGGQDLFVTKLSPSGALAYSTYLGGSGQEINDGGIAVDAAGSAYVAGGTSSTNFPVQSPIQATKQGSSDVVVAKLAPAGNALVYATYLGGTGASGFELATAVAVDAAGSAYLTGYTNSADFPVQTPLQAACADQCAFVTKLTPAGTALAYSTPLGGGAGAATGGLGIAVDAAGSAFVVGETAHVFPATPGAFQSTYGGAGDAFVAKLAPDGMQLAYATFLGGPNGDRADGVSVDRAGLAWVTGLAGAGFPLASAVQPTYGGATDAFVARLTRDGDALAFSTYLGGADTDVGHAIATRPAPGIGNSFVAAYVAGDTRSTDFPTQFPMQTDPGDGTVSDVVLARVADGLVLAQQAVAAGGTVVASAPLFQVQVTSPNAGAVTLVAQMWDQVPGALELNVTAPSATPADPLVLRFYFEAEGVESGLIAVFRNLHDVPACTGPAGTASPDPCVASTTTHPNGDVEVVVHTSAASLWTLVDTQVRAACRTSPLPGCQPAAPTKSQLKLASKADDGKDKLGWKWASSAAVGVADFGSPLATTAYQLCVYTQETLRMQALVPAGGVCDGRPCWRQTSTGYLYTDKALTPDGVGKLTLKAGDAGKAKIGVTGKGVSLPDTPLPLALPARVQLVRVDDGTCWEATYSTATSLKSDAFKAKSD